MKLSDQAWEYQLASLGVLKRMSYSEIELLDARKEINAPAELKKWRFYIVRLDGVNGGLRVEVEARVRLFLIFQSATSIGFEKMRDGAIIDDDLEEKDLKE